MKAAEYEAWYHTSKGQWIGKCEISLLLDLMQPKEGEILLDVGSGTGYFSRYFAKHGINVKGIDPDESMIEYAREISNNVEFIKGDARQLPFEDNSFDYCVAITSLCFISDPEKALSEMLRVSRKTVVLGLLNRKSILFYQKHGKGAYQGARWDTYASVKKWLAKLSIFPEKILCKSAVFIPTGGFIAKILEKLMPNYFPFGGFLTVKIDKDSLN